MRIGVRRIGDFPLDMRRIVIRESIASSLYKKTIRATPQKARLPAVRSHFNCQAIFRKLACPRQCSSMRAKEMDY
jgi:hypothetical protein